MGYKKLGYWVIGAVLFYILLVGCGIAPATPTPLPPTSTPEPPVKILFVGNSLTYYNGGLDVHFERLAGSDNPPLVVEAESVVRPMGTLETLWEVEHAYKAINEGNLDVVVLQGDIPETDVDTFKEYVRKFDEDIKDAGAETVLFMAWPYERIGGRITMEEIAQAHHDIAMELGVDVAPVGLAFQRAREERPELDLYQSDKEHPNILGTYLAANVIYATIFEKNPIGLTYLPSRYPGVTEDEAAFLQRIAWETVQKYQMEK